jgi:hypothetical protein
MMAKSAAKEFELSLASEVANHFRSDSSFELNKLSLHRWEIDIRRAPPGLASEITAAIRGIAFPFFERFRDMRRSRDAMQANDDWCFGASPLGWHSMLCIDAALGELDHFEQWLTVLPDFYRQEAEAD